MANRQQHPARLVTQHMVRPIMCSAKLAAQSGALVESTCAIASTAQFLSLCAPLAPRWHCHSSAHWTTVELCGRMSAVPEITRATFDGAAPSAIRMSIDGSRRWRWQHVMITTKQASDVTINEKADVTMAAYDAASKIGAGSSGGGAGGRDGKGTGLDHIERGRHRTRVHEQIMSKARAASSASHYWYHTCFVFTFTV